MSSLTYPSFTWAAVGGKEYFPYINLVCALMKEGFEYDSKHKTVADVRSQIVATQTVEHALDGSALKGKDLHFKNFESPVATDSMLIFAELGADKDSPLVLFVDGAFHSRVFRFLPGDDFHIEWGRGNLIANLEHIQ